MTLTLSMLRCPDTVAPESRSLQSGEFSIGRGPENDWVLADPERSISKRHCMLAYRSGCWQIADLSTNGTFVDGRRVMGAQSLPFGKPIVVGSAGWRWVQPMQTSARCRFTLAAAASRQLTSLRSTRSRAFE